MHVVQHFSRIGPCHGQIVARGATFQPNSAMPRAHCCTTYNISAECGMPRAECCKSCSISAEFGHAVGRMLYVVQHFSRIRPCRGQVVASRTTFQPNSAVPRAEKGKKEPRPPLCSGNRSSLFCQRATAHIRYRLLPGIGDLVVFQQLAAGFHLLHLIAELFHLVQILRHRAVVGLLERYRRPIEKEQL